MIRDLDPKQTSISTCFSYEHTLDELLPLINSAGFTHVSLGEKSPHSRYLGISERQSLRHLLADSDLKMDTIHGSRLDIPKALYDLSATAEAAAFLNVPVVVVHATSFNFDASEFNERIKPVLDTCEALVPIAEESGVKFALENVFPGPATEFVGYALARLPSEHFGFCYDSSHDQIGGPKPFTLLESLADRLLALHLSDRIKDHVDHVIPGEGFIDWQVLCSKISQSAYEGPICLEVLPRFSRYKDHVEFLREASWQAERLHSFVFG